MKVDYTLHTSVNVPKYPNPYLLNEIVINDSNYDQVDIKKTAWPWQRQYSLF